MLTGSAIDLVAQRQCAVAGMAVDLEIHGEDEDAVLESITRVFNPELGEDSNPGDFTA